MRTLSRARRTGTALLAAAGALALASCGSAASGSGDEDGYAIAVMLASSQNGYNQAVSEGVQNHIDASGLDVEVTVLDGGFDSDEQLSQMETAGTGNSYDGIVVVPNDGVSLAAAFPLANDIPVAVVLNPIGPDISNMQPQVDNVITTVAQDPVYGATRQAEAAAEHCADIDPCKVALLVGQLNTALDVAREGAYREVLDGHDNVEIVGTYEGLYDPDTSASAISNVLQAHPDLDVVLSNADQQTEGAQIALEDAGIDPSDVFLTGGGGTESAVQKVRDGVWGMDYLNFPVTQGEVAVEQLISHLQGGETEPWINQDEIGEVSAYATEEELADAPDFTGEWVG